jgi:hypothetical protein
MQRTYIPRARFQITVRRRRVWFLSTYIDIHMDRFVTSRYVLPPVW